MVCVACGEIDPATVCRRCRGLLERGQMRQLAPGFTVRAAFRHSGPAKQLVHRMKYQGLQAAADVLAAVMAPLVPPEAEGLVPLPRARWRAVRSGIDPAELLVQSLFRLTGVPRVRLFRAPWWWPRQAGLERSERRAPEFRVSRQACSGWVLVDDVVTSGGTMLAAAAATEWAIRLGITATGVGTLGTNGAHDIGVE